MRQLVITMCDNLFCYEVRQPVITKYDRVRQIFLLQIATSLLRSATTFLLQSATISCYKVRQICY